MNTSLILAEKIFVLNGGVTPHKNIQNLQFLLEKKIYKEDRHKYGLSITGAHGGGDVGKCVSNTHIYFQEASFGNGFRVISASAGYCRAYYGPQTWKEKNFEEFYMTSSGMILFFKNGNTYVSSLDEKHLKECLYGELSPVGTVGELISPEYQQALQVGLYMKRLREGVSWNIGRGYRVEAYLDRISRSGNFVINSSLVTPEGDKYELGYELLVSTQKVDKVKKTVLYGIKNIVKQFESLIKGGETPEVALKIANTGDPGEATKRVDFVRQNPDMGISIECAIHPCWYQGVGPINQISLSGYDEKAIAKAIGFIGEPIKPTDYSLEYKTREGSDKSWAIEISYTSPEGGSGRYWFYLDGASADAHNGNLETLSSCGSFDQYRSLLWVFLNPLREMIEN
jgi:hypothetical protein